MNKNNIQNLKILAEKYRIRETENDNTYINPVIIDIYEEGENKGLHKIGKIFPYYTIQEFIYYQQQKCKHNYKLFYYDLEEKIYYVWVGFYTYDLRYKEVIYFQDEYECQNCGKIKAKQRKYLPLEKLKPSTPYWDIMIKDSYSREYSEMLNDSETGTIFP